MRRSQKIVLGILAAIILASLYLLYPTVVYYSMSDQEKQDLENRDPAAFHRLKSRALRLGLDLKGGMHIVLEVQKPEGGKVSDVQERALEIIRNRVDKIGVTEPLIQKSGVNRIVVDLPGFTDIDQAKKLIGQTAQLQFKLVLPQDEAQAVLKRIDSVLAATRATGEVAKGQASKGTDLASADTAAKEIMEMFKQGDTTTAAVEESVEAETEKPFTSLIDDTNGIMYALRIDDYYEAKVLLEKPEVQAAIPPGVQLAWSTRPFYRGDRAYQALYLLRSKVEMSGQHLVDAQPAFDQFRRPIVRFDLDRDGARQFAALTGANIGKPLAIVLDDRVESAPEIRSKIRESGQIELGGGASWEDARLLAVVLKAGALPAKVDIIQSSVIGPSLGQDSINKGRMAAIIGLALVIIFMAFYYRLSGVIADIALLLNLLFILAFMVLPGINATLTMPGIAGIILTIGMAVDSNVLIFERIREELRSGKTIRAAIDAGYSRALLTIIDSHVTTLITALFLFLFGTGPIKGFAVTLSVGIALSLFTAFFITKVIFDIRKQYKVLSI